MVEQDGVSCYELLLLWLNLQSMPVAIPQASAVLCSAALLPCSGTATPILAHQQCMVFCTHSQVEFACVSACNHPHIVKPGCAAGWLPQVHQQGAAASSRLQKPGRWRQCTS
jgi:hypothetical protein